MTIIPASPAIAATLFYRFGGLGVSLGSLAIISLSRICSAMQARARFAAPEATAARNAISFLRIRRFSFQNFSALLFMDN